MSEFHLNYRDWFPSNLKPGSMLPEHHPHYFANHDLRNSVSQIKKQYLGMHKPFPTGSAEKTYLNFATYPPWASYLKFEKKLSL